VIPALHLSGPALESRGEGDRLRRLENHPVAWDQLEAVAKGPDQHPLRRLVAPGNRPSQVREPTPVDPRAGRISVDEDCEHR
jgi:hypothetical protein